MPWIVRLVLQILEPAKWLELQQRRFSAKIVGLSMAEGSFQILTP
jgi:hypothetical protein